MAEERTMNRSPLSAWQTEIIRLTAFPAPTMNVVDQNWWETVIGEKPVRQNKVRGSEQTDEGIFKEGRLVLAATPLRIDWLYTIPEPNPNEPRQKLADLGSFSEVLSDFSNLMKRWLLEPNLVLTRLAFGSVLFQQVDNNVNGHSIVSSYLPFAIDPNNTSDLLYRINRKRMSDTIDGLVINRVSTWSAISTPKLGVRVSVGQTLQQSFFEPIHLAHLELDINTAQEFEGDVPSEKLEPLFQELITLGIEIANDGDKP